MQMSEIHCRFFRNSIVVGKMLYIYFSRRSELLPLFCGFPARLIDTTFFCCESLEDENDEVLKI